MVDHKEAAMADEPKPDDKPNPAGDPLGDGGKKALDAERTARRAAEKAAADLAARLKEIEEKDKTEAQKAIDRAAAAEKRADEADARVLRLEVAAEKGLTASQAKRLQGTSREELEADAADLLETFKPADPKNPPPPGGKPTENLQHGTDPTETPEEMDPRKLAAGVARGH